MQKRTDTQELNIPRDDIEGWDRYPKHRWVYDLSRLLDAQNITWSPFKTDSLQHRVVNMEFNTFKKVLFEPAYIYINNPSGLLITSEVYISKGEIKLIRYFSGRSQTELQEYTGNIELRINAFVSMHFQKFTGVIAVESAGNLITAIRLHPHCELSIDTNPEVVKLVKRIYKKTDITLNNISVSSPDLVFQ
jgi:hypothetical protein